MTGSAPPPAVYVHTPAHAAVSEVAKEAFAGVPEYQREADGTPDYLRMVLSTHLYDLVKLTPLQQGTRLSARLGCDIYLKREDLQPVFSFKLRGAYNMMRQLPENRRWKGVIACSAGTPRIKWENVQRLGAKVVFYGHNFDEAKAECHRLAHVHEIAEIPPFDHPQVIAGQGTIGMEIGSQIDLSTVDAIFCAVGGGGLLAGTAAYIKRVAPPHVKVIGVETYDADALTQSLEQDRLVTLEEAGLFSDGTAVRIVGGECFRLCRGLVDGMVRVSNDEICAAIKDIFEDTRSITEPAGALATAGLKRYIMSLGAAAAGRRYVAVVSGANMNFSRLSFVTERADMGEQKEVLLSVEIPDRPGSFLDLYNQIYPRDITEFSYRYSSAESAFLIAAFQLNGTVPRENANPVVTSTQGGEPEPGVSLRDREVAAILGLMHKRGLVGSDISDNEMAKTHARYMIGGRKRVPDERLFRFRFPERPGALRKFLVGIDAGWNISLFHYRAQGGDVGKVLAGIQVPPETEGKFDAFLERLGYLYEEETHNPVYRRYLREE
ncbi:threonine ammonia-lyase [Malassezia sp. CBS 17886]|nr:threonine ammonia-lyase [Malassezia sp. CBS 17886]